MPITESAYIKLVPASEIQEITLEEVKQYFHYYKGITSKTGEQLGWEYGEYAFPYELKEAPGSEGEWFYLSSDKENYQFIAVAVGQEALNQGEGEERQPYIQISLSQFSSFGDKSKANEFCKFLAKKVKGELHLFNKRIMYFYPRK